uniref:Uncharacterized protein n=1 Tax=viral metagenome TaxID=1070528 RepID=A0A6M3M272_9ZZZZ
MSDRKQYTAFCQQSDGKGTIWIDTVTASGPMDAIGEARAKCANDWEYDVEDVHCLGLATGNVEIVYWEDLNDD